METFESPLTTPNAWTYAHESFEVSSGRYAGYKLRGLRCTIPAAADVLVPMRSVVQRYPAHDAADTSGPCLVEIQFAPFLNKSLMQHLQGGIPTIYMLFPDDTGIGAVENSLSEEGEVIRSADSVLIAMAFEDRIVRDPVHWTLMVMDAMLNNGETAADWSDFNAAVSIALGGNAAPVLLLNLAGALLETATVQIDYGGGLVFTATMAAADGGDLQATVSRLNGLDPVAMPISNLFSTGLSFTLRPQAAGGPDFQLARVEDGTKGIGEIQVTNSFRHIQFLNVHDWLAPQFVTPAAGASPALPRYTRGNKVTTFINGREFFEELFRELYTATGAGNGIHHVGWAVIPDDDLIELRDSDPADQPYTVRLAFEFISDGGGKACVMPAKFIQLDPTAPVAETIAVVILVHLLLVTTFLILASLDVSFARTEGAGFVILMSSVLAVPIVLQLLFDDGGDFIEPNKGIIDAMDSIANARGVLAPYPARVEDNPRANSSDFPFTTIFQFIDHFGVYHQKFTIAKNASGYMGYCGGIDLNPDRLDDEFHQARKPFHDTHLKFEGPAVRDIATSFEQRWQHEGQDSANLAFAAPSTAALGSPGENIVQIARTYFQSTAPARAFAFAPTGDRTILNTIQQAISEAREFIYIEDQYFTPPQEYLDELIAKVANAEIKKLILVVPEATDQPFGDISRKDAYAQLKAADVSGNIVTAGFPKRSYTVPGNEIRANSGKLILAADTAVDPGFGGFDTIELGPAPRLPSPPFYLSIEGEIMYAYEVDGPPPGSPTDRNAKRPFRVLRGESVPGIKTKPKAHKAGAAATVIDLSGIYVHSKTMIIDDAFLSLGSANVNRRGFYHDGEMQAFTIPEKLRTDPDNPIAAFRQLLWSDMLNLPRSLASSLLRDPVAAAKLFERPFEYGNRFIDLATQPGMLVQGFAPEDNIVLKILQGLGVLLTAPAQTYDKIFRGVVDPSTGLETP